MGCLVADKRTLTAFGIVPRSNERRVVTVPARLTWKDASGAVRFASVVTRDVSDVGVFVECDAGAAIPLYRLVHLQVERASKTGRDAAVAAARGAGAVGGVARRAVPQVHGHAVGLRAAVPGRSAGRRVAHHRNADEAIAVRNPRLPSFWLLVWSWLSSSASSAPARAIAVRTAPPVRPLGLLLGQGRPHVTPHLLHKPPHLLFVGTARRHQRLHRVGGRRQASAGTSARCARAGVTGPKCVRNNDTGCHASIASRLLRQASRSMSGGGVGAMR